MKVIELADTVLVMKEIIESNPLFIYPVFDSEAPCVDCLEIEEREETEDLLKEEKLDLCEIHAERGCRYFDQKGYGQCAVGHWLIGSDLIEPSLFGASQENFYTEIENRNSTDVLNKLAEYGGYQVDALAGRFLENIQTQQDAGEAWVDCYNHAVTELSRYGDHYTYPLIERENG